MATKGQLKIGFILDDSLDKTDGVQQYVLTLGEWLRTQGHDVHYLTSTTTRTDVSNVHSLGKNVAVRFNGNRMSMPLPSSRRAIKALLAREQFAVLHVQVPHSPWLAQRVIKAAAPETAIIGTFHIAPLGKHVHLAGRALALWTRSSLKRIDVMLSVSTTAQQFCRETYGLESQVLPNVVDLQRFAKAKALPAYQDKLNIVFLGRLVPRKGCATLLEAVDHLQTRRDLPPFRVIICGKGPLEPQLKQQVNDAKLQSIVAFAGFVSEADKPRYLRSADIAVFPSLGGESFGIVLIEAMAAKALVLAGDNAGYHTVMESQPELLVPPGDATVLAQKLAYYLTNAPARRKLQTWGQAQAQQFDTATVGAKLLAVYRQALRKRRGVQ